ncbi:MAG: hemerythrin family non-heme iron protein, partial [Epsilonproteobacteria bacterium]
MKIKIDQNKLVWKSEYSIGDYKTDNEHIKLFEIAKKALNA